MPATSRFSLLRKRGRACHRCLARVAQAAPASALRSHSPAPPIAPDVGPSAGSNKERVKGKGVRLARRHLAAELDGAVLVLDGRVRLDVELKRHAVLGEPVLNDACNVLVLLWQNPPASAKNGHLRAKADSGRQERAGPLEFKAVRRVPLPPRSRRCLLTVQRSVPSRHQWDPHQ